MLQAMALTRPLVETSTQPLMISTSLFQQDNTNQKMFLPYRVRMKKTVQTTKL